MSITGKGEKGVNAIMFLENVDRKELLMSNDGRTVSMNINKKD